MGKVSPYPDVCSVQGVVGSSDAAVHWKASFLNFLTDVMFKTMIKSHFPVSLVACGQTSGVPPLDYQESNALRYAAGYVPRAIRKRLERGSHPLKEELVLCLVEMCEDDGTEDDTSADWSKAISRGESSSSITRHHFFHAVEMTV